MQADVNADVSGCGERAVVPGILIVTVASAALGTAISVGTDMTLGIIVASAPWRSPAEPLLTGPRDRKVCCTLAVLILVIAVAAALGFRPTANPLAGQPQPARSRSVAVRQIV